MDRETFVNLCGGTAEAMAVETGLLTVGREFLPGPALAVLDGAEPSTEYWLWACAQVAVMRAEDTDETA